MLVSYKVPEQRVRITSLLDALRQGGVTPDFISWHLYSHDPREYAEAAAYYRAQLDQRGWRGTDLHLTEWNTDEFGDKQQLRFGSLGASRLTAAWIALQDAPLDRAFFYRGNDTNPGQPTFFGLFFADGREKPIARAFGFWQELARCERRLAVTTGIPLLDAPATEGAAGTFKPVWCLAGATGDSLRLVLVAAAREVTCNVQLPSADGGATWRLGVSLLQAPRGELRQVLLNEPRILLKANDIALLRFELAADAGK